METGFRAGTVRDVRDLCDMYGVTEADKRDYLLDLARIGKQHSRWNLYEPPFSTYIELEAAADSIHCHHSAIIPGHVQTANYARAILDNWMVPAGPESVEERVVDRLNRQRWFSEPDPPEVSFIIGEEALHRLVGGPAVMRAQLERLIEVAELPNVTIRVIPYEAGAHLALDDSFVILGLTAPMDSIVYLETIFADLLFEHSQDVEKYQEAFARLGNVAATEEDSVARIAKIIREF